MLYTYPMDASTHVQHIHNELYTLIGHVTPHCYAGYCGPWIENYWIHANRPLLSNSNLTQHFGPYIPLLLPWVDLWIRHKWKYPIAFVALLQQLLRPTVQYITVSQNDLGIAGHCEIPFMPNVVVMSAGGFGHVPIPLLARPLLQPTVQPPKTGFSFLGSVGKNHNTKLRLDVCKQVAVFAEKHHILTDLCTQHQNWKSRIAGADVGLCPRGFGRTSFRLAETIQLGTVPWYIYDDYEWIPYRKLFFTIGFSSHINNLTADLETAWPEFATLCKSKQQHLATIADSHFSFNGVMKQIRLFMTNPTQSDLEMQTHPRCACPID